MTQVDSVIAPFCSSMTLLLQFSHRFFALVVVCLVFTTK